ncbi:MAG: hypothetical protein OER56_11835, partial [Hyphomicrobiales bacterium]|nr:hypothetical protein [Hyphomicrobiales bacterium]
MSSAPKITTVKMPADPSLHPAHVVAIRPDVDGARTRRGDYVLSVETPKGARNVVAPADGVVRVHVSLMQDVAPGTELFSVSQDRPAAETRAPR